jgi:hypothetical protein
MSILPNFSHIFYVTLTLLLASTSYLTEPLSLHRLASSMALRKRKCLAMSTRRPSKRPKAISDENGDEAPSSSLRNLPAEQDPDNCVTTQSVTTIRQQLPMEIVSLILSEFITEDAMSNRDPCGEGSRLRKWRRRDICSVLLTSKEVYKEASKLMHERLNLTIYIEGDPGATECMYQLRRIGCPGPWNQFHKIKICLRPLRRIWSTECVPNLTDALTEVWRLLHSHLRAKGKGRWQQIELFCNGLSIWSTLYWLRPEHWISLRDRLQLNDTRTPTLRFDANLRILSEVDLQS